VRVTATCALRPTESEEKVRTALRNLFPDAALEAAPDRITAETVSLDTLRERIRDQQIRDTARDQLIAGRVGDVMRFRLGKQAAYAGRVSFSLGSAPLGDIEVVVEDEDLDAVIDTVAESTVGKRLKPADGPAS